MIRNVGQTVTVVADIVDPTSDGILTTLVNYGICALMVLVVLVGGWHAFKDWTGSKGEAALKILREHAYGILGIEALLGGILLLANRGADIIPGLS